MSIKTKRLGHATFETRDLEAAIAYFREVVGLSLAAREAKRAFLATEVGQLAVVLEQGTQERCTALALEVSFRFSWAIIRPPSRARRSRAERPVVRASCPRR